MNHAGEITPLARMARPHVALITTIAPVHIEYLGSLEAIADAKAEIFSGLEPGGVAVLNRDAPQFERLASGARARAARASVTFGADAGSDAQLIEVEPRDAGSRVRGARSRPRASTSTSARRARTWPRTRSACCSRPRRSAPIVERSRRGARRLLAAEGPRRALHARRARAAPFTLIDESYNANPASMRAALALLGAAEPGPNGRRIAVIGDMLELGADGAAMHAALAADLAAQPGRSPVRRRAADARALRRGAAGDARAPGPSGRANLADELAAALRGGDVVMVKGSNGSRMGPLVAALREHFARADAGG